MVRTKADGASGSSRKAVGGSAPRKALGGASTSSAGQASPSASKYGGGNPYCPRPTPDWQKGIAGFLSPGKNKDKENTEPSNDVEIVDTDDSCQAGSSSSSSEPNSSQGSSKSGSEDD